MQPWSSAQQAAQQSSQNAMRSAQQAARSSMDAARAAQDAALRHTHQMNQVRRSQDFAAMRSYRRPAGAGGVVSGFFHLVKLLVGLGVFAGIVAIGAKLLDIW